MEKKIQSLLNFLFAQGNDLEIDVMITGGKTEVPLKVLFIQINCYDLSSQELMSGV